ncbi:MAG: TIGR03086 family metal-binding protein, partial [Streptosporangiaceae bacterium]
VLAAFAADGVLDRDFALPEIDPAATFPAALAISFHFIDYVVHGWDVARALGLDYQLEPDLLGVALAVAGAVPDDDRTRRRPGAAFAPPVSAPAGASPVDQVVAQLGRPPGWAADWSAG